MAEKKRIEWIDLAKGFCILLVMWWHIKELFCNKGIADRDTFLYMCAYFRMPLYFFLSGLFFKTYSGYLDFLVRKTNKLLVPFLTFASLGIAYSLIWPMKLPKTYTWDYLFPFLPIWFLWCLFLMNNLFYLVMKMSGGSRVTLYFSVCAMGVIGYFSGENYINLLHLRSALTAMPFFVLGYAVRRHTDWLYRDSNRWDIVFVGMAFGAVYLLTQWLGGHISYMHNKYEVPVWAVYGGGVIGIYAILTLARLIKRLPIVSYLGRYSIVVLITHYPIVRLYSIYWLRMIYRGFGKWCALEEMLLLTCLEVPIIALCTHYLPWIFAQKDLIKLRHKPLAEESQSERKPAA